MPRVVPGGMVERRAAIVSIASDAGFGESRMGDSGPMKAGVMAFRRIIAKEYGRYVIRANTVCPRLVIPETRLHRRRQADIGFGESRSPTWRRQRRCAADRGPTTVAWLAADPARMLTVQVISVSGGG